MINCKEKFRRSPLFYVGDKYKIISQIKEVFPKKIDRFIEPFCGGGTVFLNTEANFYLINDIDLYVIKLHKFLISNAKNINGFWDKVENSIKKYELSASYLGKNVPLELRKQFIKTYYAKYNKESYIKMRGDFNKNKNNMLLLYLLVIYGFNRMLRFNSYGNFNSPVGNVDFNKNVYEALELYFEYVLKKNIKLYSMDYEKVNIAQEFINAYIYGNENAVIEAKNNYHNKMEQMLNSYYENLTYNHEHASLVGEENQIVKVLGKNFLDSMTSILLVDVRETIKQKHFIA